MIGFNFWTIVCIIVAMVAASNGSGLLVVVALACAVMTFFIRED